MQQIQLTEQEMAVFKPFHEFISQRRAELEAAERLFIEHILLARKATPNGSQQPNATDPPSSADHGSFGPDPYSGYAASDAAQSSDGESRHAFSAGSNGSGRGHIPTTR